jgi:lipopolysaccharide biosynthesis glycosyltransferase
MINIFIGYDYREPIAYHTCVNSIIRHSSQPLAITPLALNLVPDYIERHNDGSNDFTYLRFLVPYLMNYTGSAIYIDGDMIVTEDIVNLWKLRNNQYAAQVVKHDYQTTTSQKYLGAPNSSYPRKNWSSVILFNCQRNRQLTPEYIQRSDGKTLHRFQWLTDDEIGELPTVWNWLADEFGENNNAKLIHYTLGTPCFDDSSTVPMSDAWHNERLLTNYALQIQR